MEPITALALGGAAYYLLTRKKPVKFSKVTAKSGRVWLTRLDSATFVDGVKHTVVSVFAPANSFGPHVQVLVATYKQLGDDKTSRTVVSTGPHALPVMITEAGKDFGIKKA